MITLLGTGLLGAGFVRGLRKRGEAVRAWNRTGEKARALAEVGALPIADVVEAVRGADRVHLVLADDAAVDEVLESAAEGFAREAIVVDHSTTSTAGALERTATWAARGVVYQHAPVFMGPANAADATGVMLISGDRERVRTLTPLLAPMTGKLIDLGLRVDGAAAFKLLGNLFLMALSAGFLDMLTLAKAMDVAPDELATLFDHFNPGASVPARFKRMLDQDHANPSWELAMARKDARLMLAEARDAVIALEFLPILAARMDRFLAQGQAHADWTVIAREHMSASHHP